ncbi:MAG: DUF3857 domain-containing protein [Sphingobacteriales bacterium]|nr:MAG: DUF3857 domain-containing protein [Sphingobacteriales bacterium]
MRPLHILLALLLCICFTTQSSATPTINVSATPSWVLARQPDFKKQPPKKDIGNGAYLSLYDEQMNTALEWRYQHWIKKIVNEAGVQENAEFSVDFVADYQTVYFHEISIIRDGEKINKLKKSEIRVVNNESLSDHQVNGAFQAIVILEDLRRGDEIECSYSVVGRNPIYQHVYTDRFAAASSEPITNCYTSIISPASKKLYFKAHNNAEQPKLIQQESNNIYDWPVIQLNPYDFGGSVPSWYTGYPYVEVSEYSSWQQVATWATGIMNNYNYPVSPGMKQKIDKWKSETKTHDGFAEKALRFVQDDVRYLGIEIGVNSHKPHPPAETFSKRYGDCKDKSILLVTLLRSQGIRAYSVLVSTDLKEHINEHLPSPSLFDHVIVKAIIGDYTLYLDPTISMQRSKIIEAQLPNYGAVLTIDSNTLAPENVPKQNTGQSDITEIYSVSRDNNTPSTLKVSSVYYGSAADYIRSMFNERSMKDVEKYYEKYYANLHSSIKMGTDGITYDDDTNTNQMIVYESYDIDSIWQTNGSTRYVPTQATAIYERLPEPIKESNKPLSLPYPSDVNYKITLDMPSDWDINSKKFSIINNSYSFEFTPTLSGHTVTYEYHLKTYKDHIPVEEIAQYRKDYKKISACLNYELQYDGSVPNTSGTSYNGNSGSINWIAVFIMLAAVAASYFILRYFSKQSAEFTSTVISKPYTWWMVLLCIILFIRALLYLRWVFVSGYLSTGSWALMNQVGQTGMQLLLIIELIVMVSFVVINAWLINWFFKKRDIFPRMFIFFAFAELGYNILELAVCFFFKKEVNEYSPGLIAEVANAVVKSIVFCAVWVSAVYASLDTKTVFTRPYNYIEPPVYEKPLLYTPPATPPANHNEVTEPTNEIGTDELTNNETQENNDGSNSLNEGQKENEDKA